MNSNMKSLVRGVRGRGMYLHVELRRNNEVKSQKPKSLETSTGAGAEGGSLGGTQLTSQGKSVALSKIEAGLREP